VSSNIAVDPDGATQQIAIVDLVRNSVQRVTFEWDNASPLWTADGARLIFRSNAGGGNRRIHWQAADGSGVPEALFQTTDGPCEFEAPTRLTNCSPVSWCRTVRAHAPRRGTERITPDDVYGPSSDAEVDYGALLERVYAKGVTSPTGDPGACVTLDAWFPRAS